MTTAISYRKGTSKDLFSVYLIHRRSVLDLLRRKGREVVEGSGDEEKLTAEWPGYRALFEHMAETSSEFWVAERGGVPVGYAITNVRNDVQQLLHFFVLPYQQAGGIGRGLLARAFPEDDYRQRIIIATVDGPAQALYMRSGVYPRFDLRYFTRSPRTVHEPTDLEFLPIATDEPNMLEKLAVLDQEVIGYRRDAEHRWLLDNRQGFLYLRDGRPVGYGYSSTRNGPFALLETADFPAVLAHAESRAAEAGQKEIGFELPTVNQAAIDYLLANGYRIDFFIAFMMTDRPFGRFQNYICTSPPYFL